jgi:hypothetical protein
MFTQGVWLLIRFLLGVAVLVMAVSIVASGPSSRMLAGPAWSRSPVSINQAYSTTPGPECFWERRLLWIGDEGWVVRRVSTCGYAGREY